MRPGAGRIHEGAGRPLPLVGAHDEHAVLVVHPLHVHGTEHREGMPVLVGGEIGGHCLVRACAVAWWRSVSRQLCDPVHVTHGQRVPPVLPGTPGPRIRIEDHVRDPQPREVEGCREAGLPCADHQTVEDAHAGFNAPLHALVPLRRRPRRDAPGIPTPIGARVDSCSTLFKLLRLVRNSVWACGAAGSAPAWHAGGQGFESPQVHRKSPRFSGGFCVDSFEDSSRLLPTANMLPRLQKHAIRTFRTTSHSGLHSFEGAPHVTRS